jgi:hypothetical protein
MQRVTNHELNILIVIALQKVRLKATHVWENVSERLFSSAVICLWQEKETFLDM